MQAVRIVSAGLLAGLLVGGLSACGDDKKDEATTSSPAADVPSASPAPEELRTSDADVAAGLTTIEGLVADVATYLTSDHQRAVDQQEKIEPAWQAIEGTIKANDSSAYLSFEDQFAVLSGAVNNSDQSKADAANTTVKQAAADYLKAHPGTSSAAPTSSASPSASRSAS
jgi:hypothetical protein